MRFFTISSLAALLVLATMTVAQLSPDSVAQPFELDDRSLLSERSLLEARQNTNATTTSSAAEPSGSASAGGDATLTEPGQCNMTNHLAVNQQASWGNGFVNTCCGFDRGSQCWYRRQDSVSGNDECEIPSCEDLYSEDASRMIGFVPLTSTNGEGKYGNIFLSLGMLSPGVMLVPAMGLAVLVALMTAVSTTLL